MCFLEVTTRRRNQANKLGDNSAAPIIHLTVVHQKLKAILTNRLPLPPLISHKTLPGQPITWPPQAFLENVSSRYSDFATNWTVRSSNPGRYGRFFSFPKRPDRPWSPPDLLFSGVPEFFPEIQQPRRQVNHPLPSSTEVKSECSYTSTPHLCLHGMDRKNLRFTNNAMQKLFFHEHIWFHIIIIIIKRTIFVTRVF